LFDKEGKAACDVLIKFAAFAFQDDVLQKLGIPVIKPIVSSSMSIEEWRESKSGATMDAAWSVTLPELEGIIEPMFVGGIKSINGFEAREGECGRIEKLAERAISWIRLRNKQNGEKKIVLMLNNNPCASVEATVGGAANLDALESVVRILHRLKNSGYKIEGEPANGKELIEKIMEKKAISEFRWTTVKDIVNSGGALYEVSKEEYLEWFNDLNKSAQEKVIEAWGEAPGTEKDGVPAAMIYNGKIIITGVQFGNAVICVQPKRGCAGIRCDGVVCKILHDPLVPPTHQYIATYKYFEKKFGADTLIHVGTHGNLEFLPGKSIGLSEECFPDICAGNMPCLYVYNADNPPEGIIAKRRGLAVIVNHMQTTFTQGGVYDELEELDTLLAQYDKVFLFDKSQAHILEHQIVEAVEKTNLKGQINLDNYHENFETIMQELHKQINLTKNTQIQNGMHILGNIPQGEKEVEYLNAIIRYEGLTLPEDKGTATHSLRYLAAKLIGVDLKTLLAQGEALCPGYNLNNGAILFDLDLISKEIIRIFINGGVIDSSFNVKNINPAYKLINTNIINAINAEKARVLDIRQRLMASKEIESLATGLNGAYIAPGPAGIITRGRDDVLPTGRNFYTLDPNIIPTKTAFEVGKRLTGKVIEKFMNEEKRYPENFSMYWMSNDIMCANGEGMGQLLYTIGVRPKWLNNGRVSGFEIIPLEELGRPRIDVTVKVSGILRDSFESRMIMLDEAISAVAALPESAEQNYIRKHTLQNMEDNPDFSFEEASRRIFGAKPGTYITGVNLAIYASSWKDGKDLVDIFTFFNGYAYGKGVYGSESYKQLQSNLKTVDISYNKVATDEHDLLNCCGYFGGHGGLTAAAKELSKSDVKTYYGDTRETSNVEVRTLADEIRRVVRSRLLNPKWIEGQKEHGYSGAMNISKRVGRVYGWEATTEEVDDWIFDDIVKTFISNEENKKFFMENNPWAMEEMTRRLKEAAERKLWKPADGILDELKDACLELEGFMESYAGNDAGEYQGSAIDVIDLQEFETFKKMRELK
jgi:cobaltochelatase CobN